VVIPAVVLAAGMSTRMGRLKALLPLTDGDTFITRSVRTFLDAGVDDVVVVVGHEGDLVTQALDDSGLPVRIVNNRDYRSGQLSSLLAGLSAVDRPGTTALLLTLVDVPLVSPATVRAVVERYVRTRAAVVRPVRGNEHGHPVLIDRALFPLIRTADPAVGAKAVVRAHVSSAGEVPVEDDGAFLDIDTAEDYERLVHKGGANAS
jgi:CTP:molybdopterin cytidylyltransferase MocA